ncbi:24072_t:CDS:1 [Cetraspora pellucida]|uniref:24072_t:CDS:1 n=1 Tax=Cetraspora pellucida TaxID=1433469 RepID=A0A9N9N5G6_9GLOM|nr:24072_t:CDS:1 [Cetraspora pellucida]
MNELLSERLPFFEMSYEDLIFNKIFNNIYPIIEPEVPDIFKKLIIRCWDPNPAIRPNANELFTIFYNWWNDKNDKDSELYKQIQRSKEFPQKTSMRDFLSPPFVSKIHSAALYTSQLLRTSNFPKHLSSDFSTLSSNAKNQSKYVTIIIRFYLGLPESSNSDFDHDCIIT